MERSLSNRKSLRYSLRCFFSENIFFINTFNLVQSVIGKCFLKSFSFITLPLLTFYITREEMGFYQLFVGGLGIFVDAATLGARHHYEVEFFKRQRIFSKIQLMAVNLRLYFKAASVFFVLLLLAIGWRVERGFWIAAFLLLLQFYLKIFNELHVFTLQYQMRFFRYNAVSLCFGAMQVAVVAASVAFFKKGLLGLVGALLAIELLQFIYSMASTRRLLRVMRKMKIKQTVYSLVKESIVFVPSTLTLWLLLNIDQWMLGTMLGLDSVGLYAFSCKFPLLFDYLFASSLILVYTPFFYNKLQENFKTAGWNHLFLASLPLLFGIFLYFFSGKFFFLFKAVIAENYYPALDLIPGLVFAACIRLSVNLLQLTFKFKRRIAFIIWANIIAAGTNIMLNGLLIPKFGIQGCLMATVLSFLLMFAMHLVMNMMLIRKEQIC